MPYWQGQQRILHWRSSPAPRVAGQGTSQGSFHVAPFDVDGDPFPAFILANSFAVAVSYSWTATSVSQVFSSTMRFGLYTRSGSTLSLLNSFSQTWGATAASTGNSGSFNGLRFITVGTGNWSSSPVFAPGQRYWIAAQFLTNVTTTSMSWINGVTGNQTAFSGTMYAAGAPNATHQPFSPFRGLFSATTTAVPTTIQASQIQGSGSQMNWFPWFRIDDDFRGYA